MGEFTHFDHAGRAVMVDVSEKDITERTAVAKGRIRVSREVCHLLALTKCTIDFEYLEDSLEIEACCTVKTVGKTGVEIEALMGVEIALLTIYDMCKALDRSMEMNGIRLCQKSGGKSGDYREEPDRRDRGNNQEEKNYGESDQNGGGNE